LVSENEFEKFREVAQERRDDKKDQPVVSSDEEAMHKFVEHRFLYWWGWSSTSQRSPGEGVNEA
jgi:hypothetical protein